MGIAIADRVQQQTHIPVFYLDGGLEKLPDAYLKAGELLGNPARAAELAAECRRTLDEISKQGCHHPCLAPPARVLCRGADWPGDRARQFYALRGSRSLQARKT